MVLPPFQRIIRSLRASRRFWAAPRGLGFWEKNVCGLWVSMGRPYPDWEEKQYLQHFWISKDTFWYLSQRFGKYFKKEGTYLCRAIPPAKRLAMVLHWLAQASSFSELAALYGIAKSTVVAIVHQGITILHEKLVHEAILFPTGPELEQVMVDFEALCGLPCCGGALDGTTHSCRLQSHQTLVIRTIATSISLQSLCWDVLMHVASSHMLMSMLVDLVL